MTHLDNPDLTPEQNAYLFEEPSNLLKQELREPAVYNAIITAIAEGHTRMSEIASTVGMESSACSKYISVLLSLGILSKATHKFQFVSKDFNPEMEELLTSLAKTAK